MKHSCHPILSSILFLLAVLMINADTLKAHVSEDAMPDAVAEIEYRILLEFQPDNIETGNKLAMVLYRLDKLDEAAAVLQHVLDLDPGNFDALDTLGLVSFKQGKTQQALAYLEKAAGLSSEDLLVHYHLALAQDRLGLLDAAENSLVEALKRYKAQSGQTGMHHDEIGRIEKALAEVRAKKEAQK